jgi:hypothetical protein
VELVKIAQETFSAKDEFTKEDLVKCEAVADAAMRELAKFSSALRAANLTVESGEGYHPFSPEAKDAWEGISSLARTMRSIDGDADDVNYLIRAAVLENQLTEGVESGPKLSLANTKIGSLEKVSCIPAVGLCISRFVSIYPIDLYFSTWISRACRLARRRLRCKMLAFPS